MIKFLPLQLLILFLPFHSVFVATLLPEIKFWKELMVILFIGSIFFSRYLIFQYKKTIGFAILVLFYTILSGSRSGDFNGLLLIRTYCFPIMLLISLQFCIIPNRVYRNLMKSFALVAVLSVIYGFFQVHILGSQFLLGLGFKSGVWSDSQLSYAFYVSNSEIQRLNAGFSGPIACSVYLLTAIFITQLDVFKSKAFSNLIKIVLLIGLLGTMVRSAIVSYLFILGLDFVRQRINLVKLTTTLSLFAFSLIGLAALVLSSNLNLLLDPLLNIPLIKNTLTVDSSTAAHFSSYILGISLIPDAGLFGIGPGFLGPVITDQGFGYNIESSLLSLWIELGIFGFLLYVGFFSILYINGPVNGFVRKTILSMFLVGLLLPLQYYPELNYLLFTCIGLVLNKHNEAIRK